MVIAAGMYALGESFRDMTSGTQVLDALEAQFRSLGTTHFLVTGRSFPGRPLEPLVLRLNWGELRPGNLSGDDAVIAAAFRGLRPGMLVDENKRVEGVSALYDAIGRSPQTRIVCMQICAFLPYQAAVIAGGPSVSLDPRAITASEYLCTEAFRRLFALGYLRRRGSGSFQGRSQASRCCREATAW